VAVKPELPGGVAAAVGLLITAGILLVLPQGAVALALKLTHAPVRGWFLALHFGTGYAVLIAVASILVGLACISGALATVWATKRKQRRAARGAAPAADAEPATAVDEPEPETEPETVGVSS
jgi:hypothetical protein